MIKWTVLSKPKESRMAKDLLNERGYEAEAEPKTASKPAPKKKETSKEKKFVQDLRKKMETSGGTILCICNKDLQPMTRVDLPE